MRLPNYVSNITFYYLSKVIARIKNLSRIAPLCYALKNKGGRLRGQIICPRRGDFDKRIYRFIDFRRVLFPGMLGVMLCPAYDANRGAPICLVSIWGHGLAYILKPILLNPGEIIVNVAKTPMNYGDSAPLANFTSGSLLHNLIGKFIRAAGCSFILIRKDYDQAMIKFKSGEIRTMHTSAIASSGVIGNENHFIKDYKTAGAIRHEGLRPRVRPSAMNPVDHPMGGRTRGGAQPVNAKGVITLNRPTVHEHHHYIFYTRRQLKFVHH
jgi:large subunit ribosomal protein L2